jgi:hypothetical protein
VTSVETFREFVFRDWRDVFHRPWLILVIGVGMVRKRISDYGREFVVIELLEL